MAAAAASAVVRLSLCRERKERLGKKTEATSRAGRLSRDEKGRKTFHPLFGWAVAGLSAAPQPPAARARPFPILGPPTPLATRHRCSTRATARPSAAATSSSAATPSRPRSTSSRRTSRRRPPPPPPPRPLIHRRTGRAGTGHGRGAGDGRGCARRARGGAQPESNDKQGEPPMPSPPAAYALKQLSP